MTIWCFAQRCVVALMMPILVIAATSGALAVPQHARPAARPVIHPAASRPKLASGQLYTINDVGAPLSSIYSATAPVAFNNSGQILGTGVRLKNGFSTTDCIVYGLVKFTDVSYSSAAFNCTPLGLNSVNSAGNAPFVGSITSPDADSPVAFFGTFTAATTKSAISIFSADVPSSLSGVNFAGEAIGTASYYPTKGFYPEVPAFVLPAGTTTLEVLEPQCTTFKKYCGFTYFYTACPFGGCYINDSGTILLYDNKNAEYMTYTYGVSSSGVDLPISGNAANVWLNNAGQVVYSLQNQTSGQTSVYLYSSSTTTTTTLPTLAGSTCTSYNPISMNNKGQVLGTASGCTSGTAVYWTWDPVNGIQNLNTEIVTTKYSTILPLAVNDNGQILVSLETTAGKFHWGFLNPPASLPTATTTTTTTTTTKATRARRALSPLLD